MRYKVLGSVLAVLCVLVVSSVVLAQYPGQSVGQGSSDIWVMNLHDTLNAGVVASYINQSGDQDTTVGDSAVAPLGNTSFPAAISGLGDGWLGSMVLYSDRELASVAELYWQGVPAGDGWSGAAYSGYSEGTNDLFFCHIAKTPHAKSVTTIQCVDTVPCEISMTYRDRDGIEVSGNPFTDTIEPDSQETYDLWDPSLNPSVPSGLPEAWHGNLLVTSSQDIAGVVVHHFRQGYAAAYNHSIPGSDTVVYIPVLARRNYGGLWRSESDWSSIVVQNMNAFEITVYHSYYDRDGGPPMLTFSDTIPALASHGYNTRYGGSVDASIFDPLGERFNGGAIISSTHPIVAESALVRYPSGGLSGSYLGEPGGSGRLIFPNLYRTKNGAMWTGYSGIVVQNLDPNDAATVHAQFLLSDGTVAVEFLDLIPANASHGYNTRYGGQAPGGASTFDALGTSWSGTAIISTTNPAGIIGIVHNQVAGPGYLYLTNYNAFVE